jgi:hypothetical protein
MRAKSGVVGLCAVWLGVAALGGCSLLKKKAGEAGDAGDVTATTAAAPDTGSASATTAASTPPVVSLDASAPSAVAANAADVHRYGSDETAVPNTPLTVSSNLADAVRSAGPTTAQTLIATLKKGTAVTGIANTTVNGAVYTLVTFPDPSASMVTLEGWVKQSYFSGNQQDAGVIKRRVCGGGQIAILTAQSDECVIACSNGVSCPAADACTAHGYAENADGTPGAAVTFCVPAPPQTVTTASAAPQSHLPTTARATGVPLKCPPNYQHDGVVMCRLSCQSDADCGGTPGSHCQNSLCLP